MSETAGRCELCGEPLPAGEEMFRYHGYSGPCPKPPAGGEAGAWERALEEAASEVVRLYGLTRPGAPWTREALNITVGQVGAAVDALRAALAARPAGEAGARERLIEVVMQATASAVGEWDTGSGPAAATDLDRMDYVRHRVMLALAARPAGTTTEGARGGGPMRVEGGGQ